MLSDKEVMRLQETGALVGEGAFEDQDGLLVEAPALLSRPVTEPLHYRVGNAFEGKRRHRLSPFWLHFGENVGGSEKFTRETPWLLVAAMAPPE